MRGAQIFCFPSLYEGFGIPILEAFASRVPVVTAKNSSLPEVAGDAAGYFDSGSSEDLAFELQEILENETLRHDLIERGLEQVKKFSWKKCAQETLEYLKN
jgi:glycosyltransferase involved in cell wall biosynthesis